MTSPLTTVPTNEMLALADEDALADFIYEVQDYSHAKRKAALLWPLVRLDAAAPAAGGDERGHDWDGQYTAAEFIEIANEKYNLAKNGLGDDSSTDARALMACSLALRYAAEHMFAAPPLQAPAHSDAAREALEKINDIRNSIIGTHSLNWSEHVYPLVAALNAAGYEGMEYPEAREYYGTLVERAVKAEDALAALTAQAAKAMEKL